MSVPRCMYGHTYSKSMDQPGKVANSARGQLNRENEYFPVRVRTSLSSILERIPAKLSVRILRLVSV